MLNFAKCNEMFGNFLKKWDCRAVQRSALSRSRRELSNAYFLAKCGFATAENEPSKVCRPRCHWPRMRFMDLSRGGDCAGQSSGSSLLTTAALLACFTSTSREILSDFGEIFYRFWICYLFQSRTFPNGHQILDSLRCSAFSCFRVLLETRAAHMQN